MVLGSEGYQALVEYLIERLDLFEQKGSLGQGESIEELVSDRLATSLMTLCEQHPHMDAKLRFAIMQQGDALMLELQEVLSAVWQRPATAEQRAFLCEFVDLAKNLFDSVLH